MKDRSFCHRRPLLPIDLAITEERVHNSVFTTATVITVRQLPVGAHSRSLDALSGVLLRDRAPAGGREAAPQLG